MRAKTSSEHRPPARQVGSTVFRIVLFATVAVLFSARQAAAAETLISGQPLKVTINNGVGLLATPNSYKTVAVGAANVFGGKRPDLFVCASHGLVRALYLYRWVRDNEQGQPVFAEPVKVAHPFDDKNPPEGTIFQTDDGTVHGFFFVVNKLTRCRYDHAAKSFVQVGQGTMAGLPRSAQAVTVLTINDSSVDLVVSCSNGVKYRPGGDTSVNDYVLYDGTGKFRGEWPYEGLYRLQMSANLSSVTTAPKLFSESATEILGGVTLAKLTLDGKPWVIAGANLGNLYGFESNGSVAKPKRALFGPDQNSIRHPTVGASVVAYPSINGAKTDLIVGGEGSLYYYAYTGKKNAAGHPLYSAAQPVWQENALLYAGSLAIPSVADWDGDGALDLLVGNSEGRVLIFKNHGNNREPRFGIGEQVKANGEPIHIQPGYYGIQGPFETRWGYTSTAVTDWNNDGLPDLLLSSATARHEVFLNRGTRTEPKLAAARPLYFNGLELHGTWRVRPGVGLMDGKMAYIIQDDDNALRRFWRIDDYNVAEGGKLLTTKGAPITAHVVTKDTGPGQTGRGKIDIVDWDGDGKLDLIVGTAKRGSLPDPQNGLPWSRRKKEECLQVLFLRNTGSNAEPRYEYPRIFQFRGKDIYLGAHENGSVSCALGDTSHGPNLLVGMESGRIYFFQHSDLGFDHSK